MKKKDKIFEETLRVRVSKIMMSTLQNYATEDRREWSDWLRRILFEGYIQARQEKECQVKKTKTG